MTCHSEKISKRTTRAVFGFGAMLFSLVVNAGISPTVGVDEYGIDNVSTLTGSLSGKQRLFRGALNGLKGKQATVSAITLDYLARSGDGSSQHMMGTLYQYGIGVQRSSSMASMWVEEAATSGIAASQFSAGVAYIQAGLPSRAATWWELAARQGHCDARYSLGLLFLTGVGVDIDYAKASSLIKQAANGGFADAQFFLALMYFQGYGINKNQVAANRWLQRSLESGYELSDDDITRLKHWHAAPTTQGS